MDPSSCVLSGAVNNLPDSISIVQPLVGQGIQYQGSVSRVAASINVIEVTAASCLLAYGTGLHSTKNEPSFPDIFLEAQDEGGFVAFSAEYPRAVGQGETEKEAIDDLNEAIQLLKEISEEDQRKK